MCTQTGYCREHGVDHRVWGDGSMSCERVREILRDLTVQSPTAAEAAVFWSDVPAGRASGDATRCPVGRSGSETSGNTQAARSAGRSPHSKPRVMPIYGGGYDIHGWFVVHDCCPPAPGENPPDDYCAWEYFDEQSEAMDDAFAHVREVHTPQPCGRRDGTSDADLEAAWHFHNLQQWHNRHEQAS